MHVWNCGILEDGLPESISTSQAGGQRREEARRRGGSERDSEMNSHVHVVTRLLRHFVHLINDFTTLKAEISINTNKNIHLLT